MEWSFYIDIAHNKNSDKIKYYRYMCDNSAALIDTNSRIQANKNIPINAFIFITAINHLPTMHSIC